MPEWKNEHFVKIKLIELFNNKTHVLFIQLVLISGFHRRTIKHTYMKMSIPLE